MVLTKSKRAKKAGSVLLEKTQPQVLTLISGVPRAELSKRSDRPNLCRVREMRKHPTIALTRQLIIAPVLAAGWDYKEEEDAPKGAKEFIQKELKALRMHLLRTTFQGYIDFGWQPYEKVFVLRKDGFIGIKKLKPLLQQFTQIRVIPRTGEYNGLWQPAYHHYDETFLDTQETLCITIDYEGTDWYGHSIFENTEGAYLQYENARKGADRYDTKVAGSHWVVHYPPGESEYEGETVSNDIIADQILNNLEASGKIAVPRALEAFIDEIRDSKDNAWKIELLSDVSNATSNFIERLKYLDALLVRTFGVPERSILEGSFGTKAESETHSEAAVLNMDMRHRLAVVQYNQHLVNHLLRINWGEEYENTVYIEPGPLDNRQKTLLARIYDRMLQHPDLGFEEFDSIDTEMLKSELGIPILSEYDTVKKGLRDVLRSPTTEPGVRKDEREPVGGPE